jgi:hypothetical protein
MKWVKELAHAIVIILLTVGQIKTGELLQKLLKMNLNLKPKATPTLRHSLLIGYKDYPRFKRSIK